MIELFLIKLIYFKNLMNIRYFFIITLTCNFLLGCASSGGSHELLSPIFNSKQISKYSDLKISVDSKADAHLSQSDKDRLTHQIIKDIKGDAPLRFQSINQASQNSNTLLASVEIKRYDEGNAFARFIFYGLGQIHIDADIMLSDLATKEKLAQYEVTKTFAWHGFYGGLTDIKDVEVGFCKGVSDSITGKD